MAKYAERILAELKRRGMTQAELGQMVIMEGRAVGKQTINFLMKEKFRKPPVELLFAVYAALGLSKTDALTDLDLLPETEDTHRSAREKRILDYYDQLSDEGKLLLEKQLKDVLLPFFPKSKKKDRRKAGIAS